jgi:hypothetical protein
LNNALSTDEFRPVWKEAVVIISSVFLEGLKKTMKLTESRVTGFELRPF